MKVAGVISIGAKACNKPERLGVAGLALHYAHIITQMDNIVSACHNNLGLKYLVAGFLWLS